ncbi:MAG: tRNA lysidine(34) synthetase TilS [Phycisphaerae bacterium]|jgi:tRNA(Ile)-lysidine synthetase-like protein|nr:tRNA lysidine(34) synthetase TilS [Phycisphaerae bacterium]
MEGNAPGHWIVVGCSGGPDSTALAAILAALAQRRRRGSQRVPSPLLVAIHHGLRAEADEECAMVARLARRLGVSAKRIDVRPAQRPGNVAANARDDRYEALAMAAIGCGARAVAVAHHAADRLESLLLGLVRGRGLRAATSPSWRRRLGFPEGEASRQPSIHLVRPLLDTTKEECLAFCEQFGLAYAIDPSNADPARSRGHLRRTVMPGLLQRWPGVLGHASHFADEAELALAALERLVRRRMGRSAGGKSGSASWPSRWTRDQCRAEDPVIVAWAIRSAAASIAGAIIQRVPRATWTRIARAACGDDPTPKRFLLTPAPRATVGRGDAAEGAHHPLTVHVRARHVTLVSGTTTVDDD